MRTLTTLAVSLTFASFFAPANASASQVFPDAVQAAASLACAPQCTLCHNTNPGQPPASKPFALNLKKAAGPASVVPQDTASLRAALTALSQQSAPAYDADMDGVSDFAELKAGTDPNTNNTTTPDAVLCETVPLYGCGATIAQAPERRTTDATALIGAALSALAGLFVLRRRRR